MKPISNYTDRVLQAAQQTAVIEQQADEPTRTVARATLAELDTSHATMKAAVDMVYAWRDRKKDGHDEASIVLCGPVGTGKTHIARAVLWSIHLATDDGQPVAPAGKFFMASDLMLTFAPVDTSWGGSEVPRPSTVIGSAPIIVIDDVGAEGVIPFVGADEAKQIYERQARYFRVIDYCYTWRITLVVTSNLSLTQLRAHLGPRCWDRLSEMAPKGFMFDLTGVPSWREKRAGR